MANCVFCVVGTPSPWPSPPFDTLRVARGGKDGPSPSLRERARVRVSDGFMNNPGSWASEGRSGQTRERAATYGLRDAETLAPLCDTCQTIVSVCPPDAAEDVAQQVRGHGFTGLYRN